MSIVTRTPFEAIFNRHGLNLTQSTKEMVKDLLRFLADREIDLIKILNKGLNFNDNFDGVLLSFETDATPDTEFEVVHGMNRTPESFIVFDIDKGGVLYRSSNFDNTKCYFKCTVASATIKAFVF